MFIIKSKSKRKNVIAALVMSLIMAGGVVLESNLSKKSQFNCLDQVSTKESGWLFGCYKNQKKNRWERRFLGIKVGDCCGCG